MITAVDTSVLIAIAKQEPDASAWVDVLVEAQGSGQVVICDVVAAEYFGVLLNPEKFRASLAGLGLVFSATSLESAQLAGSIFSRYRREGGPRERLIPDFLIGAHAQIQADQIAAIDRGFLRRYFPPLRVVKPG